jgi:hypothetical protein
MQISAISAVSLSAVSSTPPAPQRTAASPQVPSPTAAQLLDEVYATRVAGKNYLGNVRYASGIYSISVAGLPGADSSGSSLFAAENALNARIDVLA